MAAPGRGNPDSDRDLASVLAGSLSCMSKALPKDGSAFGLCLGCYHGPASGRRLW